VTENQAENGERRQVGYQPDGTYVPCAECGHVPKPDPDEGFGTPIHVMPRTPGTAIHKGDCPTVALPPDVAEQLYADLAEMDRVRRRGAAEAMNYVIG
jgi:hypothetical protein